MGKLLFGLAETSLAMSVVIVLLLLSARAWGRRFAYRWRYLAWLVVALRLAVPFNLPLPRAPVSVAVPEAGAVAVAPAVPAPGTAQQAVSPVAVDNPPDGAPVREAKVDGSTVLFGIWAAGAVVFLTAQFGGYAALRRSVRRWGREAGDYEGLRVLESPRARSPMLVGFFRPFVVLPEGMGETERGFALLHEATHARRRDLWGKLLLVWCNALHWFNPLVWTLRRAAAGDVELSCDEELLHGRDEDYRRAYGAALVARAAARSRGAALTSAFSGSRGSLRARVLALLDMEPRRSGRMAFVAVCTLALLGGSLVACRTEVKRETFQAVGCRLELAWESEDAIPTALSFLPMELDDPVTGTGYYRMPETWDESVLTTLPIAADAPYTGFPDTLPNSDAKLHPGRVLAMKQMLSSQYHPTFPVTLTVEDGVIVDLTPTENLFEMAHGETVSFLDGPADGAGLVHYENETYGFSLNIPEETARRLAVLSAPGMALGEGDAPALGAVVFIDRRLMGGEAVRLVQNRLGYAAAVLCTPLELNPTGAGSLGHNGTYSFAIRPGRMDRAQLERLAGVSEQVAAELEADSAVMAALTPEFREPGIMPGTGYTDQGFRMDSALAEGAFLNFHSKNPGDGTISARWDEFSGVYHGYSLRVDAGRTVTMTCALSEGVTLALTFPDESEQVLSAGENEVALPEGTTQVELKAAGGKGRFSLEVSPAEGVGING